MRTLHRILPILGCIALPAFAASGQTVLYGNLDATIANYFPIGPIFNSFSTGATSLNLSDVKLGLKLTAPSQGTFSVSLFADSNTQPGGLIQTIGTMNDSSISPDGDVYDFPVTPSISLSPNTRYWIGLSSTGGSTTRWASTDSNSGTGDIANEWACFLYVRTGVRPSARPRILPSGCFANTVDPFIMQVTATPLNITASAPALSFSGMLILALLLAASAACFLRRSSSVVN